SAAPSPDSDGSAADCAYIVFQELCLWSRGEDAHWLRRVKADKAMGVELMEQTLAQQPRLFACDARFLKLVEEEACPLLVQILKDVMEFPLLLRVLKASTTVLVEL
ncbi:unnamed protein product, partial [Chrysoparadoxa australica]